MDAQGEPARVLHVDDDPEFLKLTAARLPEAGADVEVIGVGEPRAALDRLDEGGVDCVVSDYRLPGMDGLALLDAVREREPDLPFILFTGEGSEEVASEAISRGVTDYVPKGGDGQVERLADAVGDAVDRWRARESAAATRDRAREAVRTARQRAREALERRRARFRALIENATDVVAVLDAEGTVQYVSPSVERVVGYRPEELVGEDAFEYIHPEDRDRVLDRFRAALADPGRVVTAEYRFRAADGSWRWVEARGRNRLDDPAVEGFVVNSRDTTERREMEAALRVERDRFAALYENIPEPVVEYAFEGGEPVVRDVNCAFEETFGYGADEAVGRPLDDLIVPPDDRARAADLNEQVRSGERLDVEVVRATADDRARFLLRNVPIPEDGTRGYAIYTDLSGVGSFPDVPADRVGVDDADRPASTD